MNWKSGLMTLVAASVAVVHAAGQANAPATPAAQAKPSAAAVPAKPVTQPTIEARKASIVTVAGLKFRDLNKNGKLDPYEDWRLPVDRRFQHDCLVGKHELVVPWNETRIIYEGATPHSWNNQYWFRCMDRGGSAPAGQLG